MEQKINDNFTEENVKANKRRVKKGILLIGLTAIVLIVSTYAWFVGLTNVAVNSFELNVEATTGLSLSLDAATWSSSLTISESTVDTNLRTSYSSNTNSWLDEGLIPMSSVGQMNLETSRMNIFTKTSMTANSGGYKLIADLANGNGEVDGYVAFDLFIKNESGSVYTPSYNYLDDEGIYLTSNSAANVQQAGAAGATGSEGIENSMRVAFMQIGRIDMNASGATAKAQSISCNPAQDSGITQLCDQDDGGRNITWNIWEPNDLSHNDASIRHFSTVCLKRTGVDTYSGNCTAISDETYAYTYASNANIASSDNVNIYDGLNDYPEENISTKLSKMTYFRDSTNKANADEIFYLAANSITKVRVYIYIEGQDVDNYDLASQSRNILVNFGFTKNKHGINAGGAGGNAGGAGENAGGEEAGGQEAGA